MTRSKLLPLLLLSSLTAASALSIGCSSDSTTTSDPQVQDVTSTRDVRASTDPKHAAFGGVWAIRSISHPNLTLRLYETGGGDPALNGNMLRLGAFGDHDAGGVFELGLNVSSVTKAEMSGPDLKLAGMEDTIDQNGETKSVPYEATVKLTTGNGPDGLEVKSVSVTRGSSTNPAPRMTEAEWDFIGSAYSVRQAEKNDTIARVFETAGGDPAMNGVSVYLSLMSYPEERTYDLGLNIAGVDSMTFQSPTELRIDGKEDTMGSSGIPTAKPASWSVTFSIGSDGAPAQVIKLKRLR